MQNIIETNKILYFNFTQLNFKVHGLLESTTILQMNGKKLERFAAVAQYQTL